MRKFLKRLRKGIKSACLTAALVTCWQVGQAAQAAPIPLPEHGDVITIQFSGSVSPTVNDLSHLFLIYGTGYSDSIIHVGAVKLGDFPAGQTNSFSVSASAIYDWNLWWFTAGLHGDISGGQYVEGLNGVTLGINADVGDSWSTYISAITEETMFNYLLNDDPEHLAVNQYNEGCWYEDSDFFSPGTYSGLFDFSQASNNGQMQVEFEIVPEPVTFILLGAGGIFALRQRPRKD